MVMVVEEKNNTVRYFGLKITKDLTLYLHFAHHLESGII